MFRSLVELYLAHRHSREEWSPRQALLGRDRRIFVRVPVAVSCRMHNRLFGLESGGTTVNLGLGGVGLLAPVNWPEGSQVEVHLGDYGMRLEGMVVFRRDAPPDYRYGVKFQRLGIRDLAKLRRILRKKHSGPLAL
jgi:PilZ domain-containing protein